MTDESSSSSLDVFFAYKVRNIDKLVDLIDSYVAHEDPCEQRHFILYKVPSCVIRILYLILISSSSAPHNDYDEVGNFDCIHKRRKIVDVLEGISSDLSNKNKRVAILKDLQTRGTLTASWVKAFPSLSADDAEIKDKIAGAMKANVHYTTATTATATTINEGVVESADDLMLFHAILNEASLKKISKPDLFGILSTTTTACKRTLLTVHEIIKGYPDYPLSVAIHTLRPCNQNINNSTHADGRRRTTSSLHETVKCALRFVQATWEHDEALVYPFIFRLCEAGLSEVVAMLIVALFGLSIDTNVTPCVCAEFVNLKSTVDKNGDVRTWSEKTPFTFNAIVFEQYKPLDIEFSRRFSDNKGIFNVFEYAFETLIDLADNVPAYANKVIDEILLKWKFHPVKMPTAMLPPTVSSSSSSVKQSTTNKTGYSGADYPFSCFAAVPLTAGLTIDENFHPKKIILHEKRKNLLITIKSRDDFIFKGHHALANNQTTSPILLSDISAGSSERASKNILTFGNKHAYLTEEVASLFCSYKLAMIPKVNASDGGVNNDVSSLVMLSASSLGILTAFADDTDNSHMNHAITAVKDHRKALCDRVNQMYKALQHAAPETRILMQSIFKKIFKLGMNIRGWKGKAEVEKAKAEVEKRMYPLASEDTLFEEGSDVHDRITFRVAKTIIKLDAMIDGIPDECVKEAFYALPQFSHRSFYGYGVLFVPSFIEEQGSTLFERIELMKQGEESESIFSCLRTGSNFIIASAYFYATVLFDEDKIITDFDISKLSEIF